MSDFPAHGSVVVRGVVVSGVVDGSGVMATADTEGDIVDGVAVVSGTGVVAIAFASTVVVGATVAVDGVLVLVIKTQTPSVSF